MNTKLNFKQTMKAAAFSALTAAIINAILFFIFKALGFFTDDVFIQPNQPLTIVPILFSSILPTLIGGLLFFVLEKYTAKGFMIFSIISFALLLFSFSSPFMQIPNITMAYGIALNVLHVVVAVALLYFINKAIKNK